MFPSYNSITRNQISSLSSQAAVMAFPENTCTGKRSWSWVAQWRIPRANCKGECVCVWACALVSMLRRVIWPGVTSNSWGILSAGQVVLFLQNYIIDKVISLVFVWLGVSGSIDCWELIELSSPSTLFYFMIGGRYDDLFPVPTCNLMPLRFIYL